MSQSSSDGSFTCEERSQDSDSGASLAEFIIEESSPSQSGSSDSDYQPSIEDPEFEMIENLSYNFSHFFSLLKKLKEYVNCEENNLLRLSSRSCILLLSEHCEEILREHMEPKIKQFSHRWAELEYKHLLSKSAM